MTAASHPRPSIVQAPEGEVDEASGAGATMEVAMGEVTTAMAAWGVMMMAVAMVLPALLTTAAMLDTAAMEVMRLRAMERKRLWAWCP